LTNQSTLPPLTESELDQLSDFLDSLGEHAMNIEMLDGFFAALICSPESIPPSELLPHILGPDYTFEDQDQGAEIVELLMRHWNTISSALYRTLKKDDIYIPIMLVDEDGVPSGNDWACGFMNGVALRADRWEELAASENFCGPMMPIMLLACEHHTDPELRPPAETYENRDELLQLLIAGLTQIYRHFAPQRHDEAPEPIRRAGPKVGRNDPCPCGSGRKYKHCCAGKAQH